MRYFFLFITTLVISSSIFALQLTSPVFKNNQLIPMIYTCQGKNISPPLSWKNPPVGAESYALIVTDPDAPSGEWVHWILYNLPHAVRALPEDFQATVEGVLVGLNSYNRANYHGPCPPTGTHHYIFTLYALDEPLYIDAELNKKALIQAMQGHILATATLTGRYKK